MFRLKRPSPALVISILALVAAIVVPAYAALTKKDKKTVKNIANTEITKRAPGLAVASANSADKAKSADTAGDANTLGGQAAGDYAAAGSEPWQSLPLNNFFEPSLCFWTAFGAGHTAPAYFRDGFGVVHLKGLVRANDGNSGACGSGADFQDGRIALLPVGYRPDENQWVFATLSNDAPGRINVFSDGQVRIGGSFPTYFPTFANAKVWVSLDGIAFRCAPSGSNGCP